MEASQFLGRAAGPFSARRQLARFCAVGALGLVVNILVYAFSIAALGVEPLLAATFAFSVAVLHNYLLNRRWTFRSAGDGYVRCGTRFLTVSLAALAANLILLGQLDRVMGSLPAQVVAVILVTPISFLANKWWSFRARGTLPRSARSSRRCCACSTRAVWTARSSSSTTDLPTARAGWRTSWPRTTDGCRSSTAAGSRAWDARIGRDSRGRSNAGTT